MRARSVGRGNQTEKIDAHATSLPCLRLVIIYVADDSEGIEISLLSHAC